MSISESETVFLRGSVADLILLKVHHAPLLTKWMNDDEVTQFLARGDQPMTLEDEVEWVKSLYNRPNDLTLGVWHRADCQLIGTMGLHQINQRDQHATLGISIGEKSYWGKGVGRDVIKTLLSYAFETRNLRQIDLRVLGTNTRAVSCYESCGFMQVGSLPQRIFKRGQWHDELIMVTVRLN